MQNIILISSEFQLINSIELIDQFKEQKFHIIVLVQSDHHLKQIKRLAKKFNIEILFIIRYQKLIQYFIIFFKSLKYLNLNILIIGNCHDNLMSFMTKILWFKKLYAVDDGNILESINLKPLINSKYLPLKYFTIFNIESNINYNFLHNNYNKFKRVKEKKINDNIFIIGQPLVEHGIIEKELYLRILNKLKNEFDKELIYIVHPRERGNKFLEFKEIKLLKLNMGIEQYLINEEFLPSRIIGFYSTCLTSIPKIICTKLVKINFIDLSMYWKPLSGKAEFEYLKGTINEIVI
tara:strand:+ start:2642 stop:3520 length:879 start_codon:yes stop_codon:yes gene_type:complete